jgi:hypothetical protein
MSKTAAYMALMETASISGIDARRHYLREHGSHELGWSYDNILQVAPVLKRQLEKKGYFRVYLYLPDLEEVRYVMKITRLRTSNKREPFVDPVDKRRYLVHSIMTIQSIEELANPMDLSDFLSVDKRKPDVRHLTLGFLFVVDPEV